MEEVEYVDGGIKCERCGTIYSAPQWPFCHGNPDEHGPSAFSKSSVFPFEARHISSDGRPITIESLSHLRKVERDYGVVVSVFSNSKNNSSDQLKGDLPKYKGNQYLDQRNR